MTIYEAWSASENQMTISTATGIAKQQASGILKADAELLYRFEAATWEEAMAIHHLRQGWEPYIPSGESKSCPKCGSIFYPEGSGQCWRCGEIG